MTKKTVNSKTIIILALVFVVLVLYAFFKVNEAKLKSIDIAAQEAERALKYREETKSTLKTEQKVVNTKGFIQRQARLAGFIMPTDIHFVFNDLGSIVQVVEANPAPENGN